jgi:signal transduction histidine kinase
MGTSDAAHDLLNPITAIMGFADTLLARWDVLDDETKLEALRTIRRQSEQLKRLAENLATG